MIWGPGIIADKLGPQTMALRQLFRSSRECNIIHCINIFGGISKILTLIQKTPSEISFMWYVLYIKNEKPRLNLRFKVYVT